MKFDSKQNLVN